MSVYPASRIKRKRATKAEMEKRYDDLLAICAEQQPMIVRQVFYQAEVRNIVEKTEGGYDKVQEALVKLRRAGRLPYRWIADNTRWMRKPTTFNSPEDAIADAARYYRKALWADMNVRVEIWLEKDSLAGVIFPVTDEYDVPLMVARGYSSLSFLYSAAQEIQEIGKKTFIYHFGDYDPSGQDAAAKIEAELRGFAPSVTIHFSRVAVRPEQIETWNLPTRLTKTSDSRSKNFGKISVELDAIPAPQLRDMVRHVIEWHMPQEKLEILKAAEKSERQWLNTWAGVAA